MEIHQVDVSTAFLNGSLEEMNVTQPEGFEQHGKENLVCKFKKRLYGLKQAPRSWNQKIHKTLIEANFQQLQSDHCLYFKEEKDYTVYLALHVDDIIIATKDMKNLKIIKDWLMKQYKMTDGGEIHYILGIEITRDRKRKTIYLSQRKYLQEVFENMK